MNINEYSTHKKVKWIKRVYNEQRNNTDDKTTSNHMISFVLQKFARRICCGTENLSDISQQNEPVTIEEVRNMWIIEVT